MVPHYYDLNKRKIIGTSKNMNNVLLELNIDNILEMSFAEYGAIIKKQLAAQIKQYKQSEHPTMIKIELYTNDVLNEDDIEHFYLCSAAALIDLILIDTPRYDEKRLSIDNANINLPYIDLMKLINNQSL